MTKRTQALTGLMILSILFAGVLGCAPAGTPSAATEPPAATSAPTLPPAATATLPAPTLPAGWETYMNQGQCGYAIDHPSGLEGASQDRYSWLLNPTTPDPTGVFPNFIYISVVPDDFQSSEPGVIYNYDPAAAQTLLGLQVGESRSLSENADQATWFTYTRLPDRTFGSQAAQAYENAQPWEFPAGTKEIRYYLKANGCTYLVGGYMAAAGSEGAIDEALFDQIIATFRLTH